MKKRFFFLVFANVSLAFFFFTNNCFSQLLNRYVFKINNRDPQSFGFSPSGYGGPGDGASAIVLHDTMVFIYDSHYRNIKKVDIGSGKITKISHLGYPRGFTDIAVLGDKILVGGDRNYLYILNTDLDLTDSIAIPAEGESYDERWSWIHDGKYFEWSGSDLFLGNGSVAIQILPRGNSVEFGLVKEMNLTESLIDTTAHGKSYSVERKNDSWLLENEYGTVMLNMKLPKLRDYDGVNIDFDSSRVVFFDVNLEKLTLYVCRYNR
jgi:hypothetical protein